MGTGGGLSVAVALHMGAHLDNVTHTPDAEIRIRVLRTVFLVLAAGLAARSLRAQPAEPADGR